jgi:hypothetical protein
MDILHMSVDTHLCLHLHILHLGSLFALLILLTVEDIIHDLLLVVVVVTTLEGLMGTMMSTRRHIQVHIRGTDRLTTENTASITKRGKTPDVT